MLFLLAVQSICIYIVSTITYYLVLGRIVFKSIDQLHGISIFELTIYINYSIIITIKTPKGGLLHETKTY